MLRAVAGKSDGSVRTETRQVAYACKDSTVKDAELLTVEPTSEGLCGADVAFGLGGEEIQVRKGRENSA